jgi:type I restriction-modification system DNA methylase subunit
MTTHLKTGRMTKTFGDFFTPPETAERIAEAIWPDIVATHKRLGRPVRILEPSAGTGSLLKPLIALSHRDRIPLDITAVELQEDYVLELRKIFD